MDKKRKWRPLPDYMIKSFWKRNPKYKEHAKLYFIFKRDEEGKLCALSGGWGWEWNYENAHAFHTVPGRKYFKPNEGHFIVINTRKYTDIKIMESVGRDFLFNWQEIN